jgi:hypothetical protein
VLHHPVQCAVPSLAFISDDDAELARDARRRLLAVAAGTDALVFGTHFATCPRGTSSDTATRGGSSLPQARRSAYRLQAATRRATAEP